MYYEDSLDPGPDTTDRPPQVPEKFWDQASGSIRTEALLRAYLDMEKRHAGMVRVPAPSSSSDELASFRRALGVPDTPDGYCIECRHEMLASDPEVNHRLHQAGFTPQQAQLVYDLAHERVIPMMDQMREEFTAKQGLDKLKDYFGGDGRWGETARQVSTWGKANLSPEVYAALASSPEGIIAMEKMMASGEPAMGRTRGASAEPLSEEQLKKMMADPRYWKKRDPAWIAKVQDGFTRLHGED